MFKKVFISLCLLVVVLSVIALQGAKAADTPGEALTISPLIIEKQANAGDTFSLEVKIRNDLKTPQLFKNYINDFETSDQADEQGVPKLIFDQRDPGPHSIRPFLQATGDFTLGPKQTKTVTFKVTIPPGTTAGGYYGSIRFTAQPTDTSNQVDLTASIGNLTFIQIGGAGAKEDLKITQFFTSDTNYNKKWFFENGPIQFNEWTQNVGNTFLRPTGKVEVYDIFNRKVAEFKVNDVEKEGEKPRYVLPDSQRKFFQRWDQFWLLGPYTAKLYMIYGNASSTTIDTSATFWVIPWKLILIVLAVLSLVIWLTRRGLRRYKESIVKEARKHQK